MNQMSFSHFDVIFPIKLRENFSLTVIVSFSLEMLPAAPEIYSVEGGGWVIRCPLPLIVCASVQINNLRTQINRGIHHVSVPKTVTDFFARLLREQDTWHCHFHCEKWQLPVNQYAHGWHYHWDVRDAALDGWAVKFVVSTGVLFIVWCNLTLFWWTAWLGVSFLKRVWELMGLKLRLKQTD